MGVDSTAKPLLVPSLALVFLLLFNTPSHASAAVARERLEVPGHAAPHTPPHLNMSIAYRYATTGARPRAILVLQPGLSGGAGSLDNLARQIARHGIEVWVHERRSNLLEDHTGLRESLRAGNPAFAVAYYFGNLEIGGRRFHPVDREASRPLVHWGLDVHMRDLRALIAHIERARPGVPIFLGGHSLGGILSAMYAAYDFGVPADNGYSHLRGLIFLDGLPVPAIPPLSEHQYRWGFPFPIVGWVPGAARIEAGAVPPYLAFPDLNPRGMRAFATAALLARFRPGERASFPLLPTWPMPVTNEAAFAMLADDNTNANFASRARLGLPDGVYTLFSDPAGRNPNGLIPHGTVEPHPGRSLVGWRPAVDTGEITDLRDVIQAAVDEVTDMGEWYFPLRLALDVAANLTMDANPFARRIASVLHNREVSLPMLSIGAGQGILHHEWMHRLYPRSTASRDVTVRIAPGFAHLDVVLAGVNPIAAWIVQWVVERSDTP